MTDGPSPEDVIFGRAVIAFKLASKEQVEACAAEQKRFQSQGRPMTLAQVVVGRKLISVEQYRRLVQEIQKRQQAAAAAGVSNPSATMLDLGRGPGATGLDIRPTTTPGTSPSATGMDIRPASPSPGATGTDIRTRGSTNRLDPRAVNGGQIANPGNPGASRVVATRPDTARLANGANGAHTAPNGVLLPPDITASGRYANDEQGKISLLSGQPIPPSDDEIEKAAQSWEQVSKEVAGPAGSKAAGGDPGFEVVPPSTEEDASPPSPTSSKKITTPQAAKERRDAGIRKMLGVPEDAEEFDFGPYRIKGEVASGGMGIIYRAVDTGTNSTYALKALLNVENANEKQLKRFIAEAQSALRLDHPYIVKIYDLGVYENIPYFTMDMIPGKDLHHLLRDKVYPTEKVLEILRKVCDAVDYAHKQGVIHRDLKPANIIVRPDEVPILTDFGLAKNLDSQFKLTAEGAMVGTPLYLSPEQVSGKANLVDARCDVYGLGVMLYQILTDRLPFFGRNPYEVYRRVMEEDPTPPTQINPAISPEIEKVCLMALAKDREERYESAKAMGDDIGRFLRGEPVQAKLPSPAKKKAPAAAAAKAGAPGAPSGGLPIGVILGIGVFGLVILAGLVYIATVVFGE